jgi:hypothetical protein
MNKLFLMRLSDKPGEVVEYTRKSPTSRRNETVIIFQVNEKKFTFTSDSSNICWIAELGKYDASKAKDYPAKTGNPGGYPVERLALVWKHEAPSKIKEFINA